MHVHVTMCVCVPSLSHRFIVCHTYNWCVEVYCTLVRVLCIRIYHIMVCRSKYATMEAYAQVHKSMHMYYV